MRFGTLLAAVFGFFFVIGVLYLFTDYVQEAALWLNGKVGVISHVYLLVVVLLGVARGVIILVELRRGTLPIERAQPRESPDLLGTFGAGPAAVIDAFTAYVLFATGFAVMVVDLSGRLSAGSPDIPIEGLIFIFLVSTAMVGGAFWFTYHLLASIIDSPVVSMPAGQAIGIVTPTPQNTPTAPVPASVPPAPPAGSSGGASRSTPPPPGGV